MKLLGKYCPEILISFIIVGLYFLFRFLFLNRLPIFNDEAIYMRWAQIAAHDATWRFISLTDGKQPMFIWVTMVMMKLIKDPLLVKDPLLAGRFVSVISGFFTLIGLWFLSFRLFNNKNIAFLTSALYVFYPFAQVYDRMALMDGMVGTFAVWALYFALMLLRKTNLGVAYTLGVAIGAGMLTKSSDFFSAYLLPFTLILFDFKSKRLWKRLLNWAILALFAVIVSQVMYNILRLSPFFGVINIKNYTFIYPISKWIHHPFLYLYGNFRGLFSWLIGYLTLPYIILILVSLVFIKKDFLSKTLLFLYFFLPFLALALFGKVLFPRYIYFMTLTLIPLSSWGLWNIIILATKKFKNCSLRMLVGFLIVVIFTAYPAFVSLMFAVDPINAPIVQADSTQYINGWPAGWGVKQSVAFFTKQAQSHKIFVATEGTFGLMPEAMQLYLIQNKNITVEGFWPINNTLPAQVLDYAGKMPSYFIFYQPQHIVIPPTFPLKLIFKFQNGDSNYFYRVYKIIAPGK